MFGKWLKEKLASGNHVFVPKMIHAEFVGKSGGRQLVIGRGTTLPIYEEAESKDASAVLRDPFLVVGSKTNQDVDELKEYFKIPLENEDVSPRQCWVVNQYKFPRQLHAIPDIALIIITGDAVD